MPIVTGKPPSVESLARKLLKLQQMHPNGFRSPPQRAGGALTLTEKVALATGSATMADFQPAVSDRMLAKRQRRKETRAVLAEQRRLGGRIHFDREKQIIGEMRSLAEQ